MKGGIFLWGGNRKRCVFKAGICFLNLLILITWELVLLLHWHNNITLSHAFSIFRVNMDSPQNRIAGINRFCFSMFAIKSIHLFVTWVCIRKLRHRNALAAFHICRPKWRYRLHFTRREISKKVFTELLCNLSDTHWKDAMKKQVSEKLNQE